MASNLTTSSDSEIAPVCLVTGGSSGIGLATAKRFAREGYRVAICGRSKEKLRAAVDQIQAASDGNSDFLSLAADLSQPGQAQQMGQTVLDQFGRIDVLVNNAGLAPLAAIEDITEAQFESTLNVNLRSVFYLTQLVWRSMAGQGGGVIVNISSLAAVDPFLGFSLYGASKAWLDLLTQALAAEGEPRGIRICSIRPGAVETPLLRGLFPDFPADQCVSPSRIAEVAWGCVHDPQQYPSGQAFPVTDQPQ